MVDAVASSVNKDIAGQYDVQQWHEILDTLPIAIILVDKQGIIYQANSASLDLLGSSIIKKPWFLVVQQKFIEKEDDGYEVSLVTGEKVRVTTQPLPHNDGQIITLTDLTETRALQESLNRYQRLSEIGRMSAAIAHQIRTPLASALIYAKHLSCSNEKPISSEHIYKFSNKVLHKLQSLENQLDNMLLFARGKEQCISEITAEDLVSEIFNTYHSHLILCLDINPGVKFLGNIKTFSSAMINLIENSEQELSSDKIQKAKKIKIKIKNRNNATEIVIADNGRGISKDVQKRVLEPFYTTKQRGTGLGLSVAQSVATAHHGKIGIKSIPEKGTVIRITLPEINNKNTHQKRSIT